MFHHRRDASKVALVGLSRLLRERGYVLHDVQWLTPHLSRLGAVEIPRTRYLRLLHEALSVHAGSLGPLPEPLRLLE
jgi:leucyl/phenylalanyl-tRNA--protein transferase